MKTKRFLSILLSLVLVLGMLPGMSLTAYADGNTTTITPGSDDAKTGTGTMTITLKIKAAQTITASDVTATYGNTDKAVSASVTTPSTGGGTISYAVKEGSGEYIGVASDGKLTIKAVPPTDGKAYVIVTAAATDDYAETTREVTVNISTKAMTVSASDVTATADGQPHGITVNVTDPATGYTVKYGTEEGSYTLDASPTQTEVGEKTVYYQVTADNYTTYTGSAKVKVSAKQTQTITAENVTAAYGDTGKSIEASTSGDGTLSYAVKSGDAVTVNEITGALTIVKAGSAVITVTASETATYTQATKDVTVTINKANAVAATVTANNRTYDGTEKPLVTVTGTPTGGTMHYALGENATTAPANNLYTTSIPTGKEAGTYYVYYKVVGDANHSDSAVGDPIEVKIEKAANTVTVSLDGWTYGDTANTPTATATYGADRATFTYSTSADGTYVSDKPVNAGTYYVKAAIAESTNYKSAVSEPVPFTIAQKELSNDMLTLTEKTYEHNGDEKTPTITVKDGTATLAEGTDYTVDSTSKTSSAAYGTYTIKVNGQGNYKGSAVQEWQITDKTNPTAEIKIGTNSFKTFLNTISFGLFFNKTETVTITAEDAGSGVDKIEYLTSAEIATTKEAVDALTGTWTTVTDKTSTSFAKAPEAKFIVYAKVTDVAGNVTYVTSEGVVFDTTDPVITVDGGVPAATYHKAVSWTATDENLKDVVITFTAEGATAGTEIYNNATTGEQTKLESTDALSDLGSYTIKATDKAGNPKEVTFAITGRDAVITGKADSITYEADKTYDLSQLFTVESGVTVDTYEIVANADTGAAAGAGTVTGSTLTVTKAGLITIKATVAAGQTSAATPEYINKTTAEGRLTVSRAAGNAGITINDVVYGKSFTVALNSTNAGVTPEIKYTMTADAVGNEIPAASQTESTDKPVNVGTYKAVVTYPASGLYNAVSAQTTFKITPATLTVTAEAKEKTYGGTDPAFTYTASGFVYEDTKENVLTGALTRAAGESVGTYAIGQGTLVANGNYTISYTGADLTIGKKTLTVTADAKSKTYGGEDPALTYTVSGLENGDTKESVMTGALTRAAGEDVGTYAIGQGTLAANGNYTVSYIGADLTIGKKTLTVAAEAKSKTYGGEDPALTYTVNGLENGDTKESVMTGALTRAAGEDVGTYAIGQGTLAANGNYTISYTGADLTIGKKILTVTAEAKSKKYGEDDPALTYTATGFENGDTKDTVFTGALTRKSGEAVGTYAIEQGTLAANDNYTVSYTGADLTITKTESKVTAPTANSLTYTGKAQALITAGSTEDGTLVYSLDGETYTETIPTATNAGTYTVYYMVTGDSNHNDADAATVSVTINKAEMADKTVPDAVEVISAGVTDETIDLKEYLEDGVKLEKAEKSGELADYITAGGLKDGIFTYSVAENDGGITGSILLTVSSTNYKDYTIRIDLVAAKKITEVVVESEEVEETAVETVEVPALEDFTEAQPEATVEVKMEVKLESEETVEKELGTVVLEDIKETVTKAFGGVASTELSQEYLDITVTKSVDGGTPQEIADVNRVLEIAVGYDLTGKFNPVVIREHGGAVSQFTKLNSRPAAGSYKDGTFFVEGSGKSGVIFIYARYFSTYTVAYTTTASYQVTFDDATGDAKTDSNVMQVVVATGTKVAKPADPKRDGYDFEGWYVSGTDTKWNFDTAVTSDITLVAHWDEEDDDDDEIVPASVVPVVQPRSPKTSDALPSYAFWLILAAAGICSGIVSTKGRKEEKE